MAITAVKDAKVVSETNDRRDEAPTMDGQHNRSNLGAEKFPRLSHIQSYKSHSLPALPTDADQLKRSPSLQTLWDWDKTKNGSQRSPPLARRSTEDPVPLKNLGNTCYMNSMVQSLFTLTSFFAFLKEKFEQAQTHGLQDTLKMTKCLLNLYSEYHKQKAIFTSADEIERKLESLKSCVAEKSSQFNSTLQQDTVEFLTLVLGTIDEEFERIKDMPSEENPIKKYFELEFESCLKCLQCGQNLPLPMQKTQAMYLCIPKVQVDTALTMQQIVLDFFRDERIEHKCEVAGCDGREKIRSMHASKLPHVVVLQLGRYNEEGTKKQDTIHPQWKILIPESEEQKDKTQSKSSPTNYRLVAVVCHHGSTLYGGHYVSYVFQQQSQTWHFCDDDSISLTCLEKVQEKCKTAGYCFFYVNDSLAP